MAISEIQLSSIETSLAALLSSGVPLVPELRRQFPQFTFLRCSVEDMDARPYHTGNGYQLYLLNRQNICINLTDSPEQADGVVVAL